MSIIHAFDPHSPEIFTPQHLLSPIEGFPETVLVTFRHKIVQRFIARYSPTIIKTLHGASPVPIYQAVIDGQAVGLYQTLIGGAGTVGLLEEIIALGGKKFIFFGSCGTLRKDIAAGHFILPTAAYRDEGVSYHYAPADEDYYPVETQPKLAQIFNQLQVPFIEGKTWTTDAIYRETRNNMQARRDEGCICVDMECASIMTAGHFRGVQIYQYLYGEDTLDGEDWDARTMGKVPPSADDRYLSLAVEIAALV